MFLWYLKSKGKGSKEPLLMCVCVFIYIDMYIDNKNTQDKSETLYF